MNILDTGKNALNNTKHVVDRKYHRKDLDSILISMTEVGFQSDSST